jgi:hypothetical protein
MNNCGEITEDSKIIHKIALERQRQDQKWGDQHHTDLQWKAIFEEEFAEFWCKVACEYSKDECLDELIQSAAVLCAWAKDRFITPTRPGG